MAKHRKPPKRTRKPPKRARRTTNRRHARRTTARRGHRAAKRSPRKAKGKLVGRSFKGRTAKGAKITCKFVSPTRANCH